MGPFVLLVLLSPPHTACFCPCRRRLVGRLALRLVSLLACRLAWPVRFRSIVRLVVSVFVSFASRRHSVFRRLVCRLVVCLSGAGRWIDCGMRWARGSCDDGGWSWSFVVLVLLACSRLPTPAGIRLSRPPRLRLPACLPGFLFDMGLDEGMRHGRGDRREG